ncbi:MAG: hypothetical protein AAGD96_18155 [Chloroflexota bacterium]
MARLPQDLDVYTGCDCDQAIGLDPLAVGFLGRKFKFPTGKAPAGFIEKLLPFCHPNKTVCHTHGKRKSPFDNTQIEINIDGQAVTLGGAEIRVIGQDDIFAAPDLIYHYVADHHYLPPAEFIEAVLNGPQPNSAEFRALINTLRTY